MPLFEIESLWLVDLDWKKKTIKPTVIIVPKMSL
jgi:hypothetical protein